MTYWGLNQPPIFFFTVNHFNGNSVFKYSWLQVVTLTLLCHGSRVRSEILKGLGLDSHGHLIHTSFTTGNSWSSFQSTANGIATPAGDIKHAFIHYTSAYCIKSLKTNGGCLSCISLGLGPPEDIHMACMHMTLFLSTIAFLTHFRCPEVIHSYTIIVN